MKRKPMTSEQAVQKYECSECKKGGWCEYECVMSRTCSTRCQYCHERIWFDGSWGDSEVPNSFTCPSCGKKEKSPFYRRASSEGKTEHKSLRRALFVAVKPEQQETDAYPGYRDHRI